MRRLLLTGVVLAFCVAAGETGRAGEDGIWRPAFGLTWQLQLQGRLDLSVAVDVYDVDMFETSAAEVAKLHDDDRRVICYVSAGSWERWRPDADEFPEPLLGRKLEGWPGERWLDIRRLRKLRPIMNARIDKCRDKGFDAIDYDNVNAYKNPTGFPLTGADQKRYNRYLAAAAHKRGLAAGLKNDIEQIDALESDFDFAVNEQCFQYHECGAYRRFIDAGKAVFHVEYELPRSAFCDRANARDFSSMKKLYSLRAWRRPC